MKSSYTVYKLHDLYSYTELYFSRPIYGMFTKMFVRGNLTNTSLRYYKTTKAPNRIIFKDAIKTSQSPTELLAHTFLGML